MATVCVCVCVDVTIRTADHAAKISTFAKVKGSVYYLLRVLSNTAAIFIYVYIYIYIVSIFNRATLCVSAAIAVIVWLSVCHTQVLYRNG